MSLEVVELSSGEAQDDAEITRFLDTLASTSGSVLGYHYPFYRDMLRALEIGEPLYLAARRSGQMCGFLPVFEKIAPSGIVLSSLPFFGPNAGVLSAKEDCGETHSELLGKLLSLGQEKQALSCSVYTPFQFRDFELYDAYFGDAAVTDKFTQYLDLSSVQWSKDVNYDLRKAQKATITITSDVTGERLERFFEIYWQNCLDYDIPPKPRACLEFLTKKEALGATTQIYFAMLGDLLVAGLLVVFSPSTMSYYLPCSAAEYRSHQPGSLLIDRAIKDARSRGIRFWNWESSPRRDSGVYAFKEKWGSREDSYRVYCKTFQSEEKLRAIGKERLANEFPYYYVWPFDRL